MVSYTFTLAPKANKTGERSIIISFIKDRKNTSLSIGKTCKEKDWSFDACRLKTSHPNHANLNKFIERRIKIIDEIIDDFDKNGIYFTLPDLINKLKTSSGQSISLTYTSFHEDLIRNLLACAGYSRYRRFWQTPFCALQWFHRVPYSVGHFLNIMFLKKHIDRTNGG